MPIIAMGIWVNGEWQMKLMVNNPKGALSGLMAGFVLTLMTLLAIAVDGHAENISRESPVVKAVRKIGPAVVNISSRQEVRQRTNPFSGFSGHPFFDSFFKDFFDPDFERHYQRASLGGDYRRSPGIYPDQRPRHRKSGNHRRGLKGRTGI